MSWLQRELVRVGRFKLRVHHLLTTIVLCVGVFVGGLLIGAWFGAHQYPYRTLPRPPLPASQKAPPADCTHTLGSCLPQPNQAAPPATTPTTPATTSSSPTSPSSAASTSTSVFTELRFTTSRATAPITGPDFSNNNPVYSHSAWQAIARHSRFTYLKSVEGTGYYDPTAGPMGAQARSVGVPAGGYDFLHICQVPPISEGAHFVAALRAQGLLVQPGTLPPAGDAEFPFGNLPCNARVWMQTWTDEVYNQDGHVCPILYTGAWWWQPHIGAYWPTCRNVQLKTWISGYNVRYPYMAAGVTHLDLWQFSDRGFNGYNSTDLSVWHSTPAAFVAFVNGTSSKPKPKPNPYAIYPQTTFRFGRDHASERRTVQAWDRNHCRTPVRSTVCKTTQHHLILLRRRDRYVAYHTPNLKRPVQHPRWGQNSLGRRFQGLSRRIGH